MRGLILFAPHARNVAPNDFRIRIRAYVYAPFPPYHACPICSKLKYSQKADVGSIKFMQCVLMFVTALASCPYVRNFGLVSFAIQTVCRIEITGRIDALSTGITIVDLPGYGDLNNARFDIYIRTNSMLMLTSISAETTSPRNTFRQPIAFS
jgi:hypothetical protein